MLCDAGNTQRVSHNETAGVWIFASLRLRSNGIFTVYARVEIISYGNENNFSNMTIIGIIFIFI